MLRSHLKTFFGLPKLITSTRFIPVKLIHTGLSKALLSSEEKSSRISYMSPLDYIGLGPYRYNNNFQDITPDNVSLSFSKHLNAGYLYDVDSDESYREEVDGRMFGVDARPIICLIIENKETHIRKYVHFILDITAPYCYMIEEAFKAFGQESEEIMLCNINGKHAEIYRSRENFGHVNILGIDYLTGHNINVMIKPGQCKFTLRYNKNKSV